jgi:hypothetical protein
VDQTQNLVDVFATQLNTMTDAYMSWSLAMADEGIGGNYMQPETSVVEDTQRVMVVDLFSTFSFFFPCLT